MSVTEAHLVGALGNGDTGANLGRTATINDTVVANQITDDAESIVQCPLGLVNDL